ncbi:33874_t:CDS:2 [Gigaspora margarita]|uniref:33874_t:CDS:1 n=1 Tax=Gigaspora margarita TaxID=4874 RepID=A0ABN7UM27_GIGMA|nr:33874_t:CDS:2 [Gigaspora margarita]
MALSPGIYVNLKHCKIIYVKVHWKQLPLHINKLFSAKTRLDGLLVMGFDNPEIYKILLNNIHFHPYSFKIRTNINLTIFGTGKSNNPDWKYARKGYQSSFVHNFYKTQALFLQKFIWNQIDSAKDQAMLKQLYECRCLQTIPESYKNIEDQFWNAFHNTLDCNICGTNRKRKIISIIANKLSYDIIKEKSFVSIWKVILIEVFPRKMSIRIINYILC